MTVERYDELTQIFFKHFVINIPKGWKTHLGIRKTKRNATLIGLKYLSVLID